MMMCPKCGAEVKTTQYGDIYCPTCWELFPSPPLEEGPRLCTCPLDVLTNKGCRCGGK